MMINILLTFKKKWDFQFFFRWPYLCNFKWKSLTFWISITDRRPISSCHFTKDGIFQIINKLYPNKAYDRYKTGICMLKIRSDSIYRPLNIILETCLRCGYVSLGMGKSQYCSSWKKVISKPLKTTIMSHFYRFVVKYLNDCFIMKYLTLFRK